MNTAKTPSSLRSNAALNSIGETFENYSGRKVSAVAGLMAVATFSGAEAQQSNSNLPPVTVDAPVARARPAVSKPTADQIRARNALRRADLVRRRVRDGRPRARDGRIDRHRREV